MTPLFQVLADGKDFTAQVRDRSLSLTITDEAGYRSDSLELRLDDRDGAIELPRKGAEIEVFLGYRGQPPVRMGLYVVDELELAGPPDTLTVRARAANMRQSLKQQKTRAWHDLTIGQVLAAIAAEHGLEPRVGQSLKTIPLPHADQTDESDLHFLTRMAKNHRAIAKPLGPWLIFVPRGQAKTATGRKVAPAAIHRSLITSHRVTLPDRGRYNAVVAHWYDTQAAVRTPVRVGIPGMPSFTLRPDYPDPVTARAAAQAKLETLNRHRAELSLTLPGNPLIQAETPLSLSGFRQGVNGLWIAATVRHQITPSGFTSRVQALSPKNSSS